MNNARAQLMAKARGFTISIEKMAPDQRHREPTGDYGADYNQLRVMTLEFYPELQRFVPPELRIQKSSQTDSSYTSGSYSELDTFAEQIYQLLAALPEKG